MSLSRILAIHSELTKKAGDYYKEIQAWYLINENGQISGVSMNIPKETEGDSKKSGRKKAFKLAQLYYALTSLDLSNLEAFTQTISKRKIISDDFISSETTNDSPNNEDADSETAKAKAEYEKLCKETHEKFVNHYSDFNTQLTEFKNLYANFDAQNPNLDLTPLLEKFAKHLINNQDFNPDMINDVCKNVLPGQEPVKLTIKDIFNIIDKFNASQISRHFDFDMKTFEMKPKLDAKDLRIQKCMTFFNTHLADENIINSFKDIFNNMYTEMNKPSQLEETPEEKLETENKPSPKSEQKTDAAEKNLADNKTTKETSEKANEPEQEKLETENKPSPKSEQKTNAAEKNLADNKTTKETSEKINYYKVIQAWNQINQIHENGLISGVSMNIPTKTNAVEKNLADNKTTKETSEKTNEFSQKNLEADKTTTDKEKETHKPISYEDIEDKLINGTLEQTKELVNLHGIEAWCNTIDIAPGATEPEKLTLLYHLIQNRYRTKHAALKIQYLFNQQPDCSAISLMHAAIYYNNAKHMSKQEQMLTNYIIAELINHGASPYKSVPDDGNLAHTTAKARLKNMTTEETSWLVGVLASRPNACENIDYFSKNELHKSVLEDNSKELKSQLATSPKKANKTDLVGNTPLHDAVVKINANKEVTADIIKSLVEHGAHVNRKNKFGKTPWDYALCMRQNNPEILRALKPEVFTLLNNIILNPRAKNQNLPHLVKIIKAKELTPIFHSLAAETNPQFEYSKAQLKTAQKYIYQQLYLQQQITRRWRTLGVIAAAVFLTPFSLAASIPLWRKAKRSEAIQQREVDKDVYERIRNIHKMLSAKQNPTEMTTSSLFNKTTGTFKKVISEVPKKTDTLELLMFNEQADIFDSLKSNISKIGAMKNTTMFAPKNEPQKYIQDMTVLQERSLMKTKGIR